MCRPLCLLLPGAALGFTFHQRPIAPAIFFRLTKSTLANPHDSYGLSKLLGELTCKSYSDAHGLNNGMPPA